MMSRARFITLEGLDGAGKTTHLAFIRNWLAAANINAVFTREPGGTPLGEKLRALLLDVDTDATLDTETLLMFASRQELLSSVIRPALAMGRWVVSDRFTDATFAYQGGGRGVPAKRIAQLEEWVQQGLQPDLTILLDVPLQVSQQRLSQTRLPDRFEREREDFHQRVRDCYLARAAAYPQRFFVVDASGDLAVIQRQLADRLAALQAQG
ncbi:thymidylate kinase [Vogesella fluminis]|uniref:Thymidylate kinase n=2 Tax=Vogesella fluminis TaxID=1069161 RepID=A0ABQ3HFX0_9NEIS|nr:dTMP kinase [Vogesella fluminis]GHD80014.1 thymidylate kinase [Vogesella fluminis]